MRLPRVVAPSIRPSGEDWTAGAAKFLLFGMAGSNNCLAQTIKTGIKVATRCHPLHWMGGCRVRPTVGPSYHRSGSFAWEHGAPAIGKGHKE
jgi:hypothetical protein